MRIRQGMCALVAAVVLAAPGVAQAAEPIFEKYKVPTVDGAEINVEVMRPAGEPDAPVVLTYSPYNTLSETSSPNLANETSASATSRKAMRGRSRTCSARATPPAAGTTAGSRSSARASTWSTSSPPGTGRTAGWG